MNPRDHRTDPPTPGCAASDPGPRRVTDPTTGLEATLNPCGRVRLVGFLGRDRELCWTRERTWTTEETVYDPILEDTVETEVEHYREPKPYVRLSLAVHEGGRTRWHQLKVWEADRVEKRNVLLARKGDRVEVTGRFQTRRFTGEDGREKLYTELVVETLRRLRPKIRLRFEPDPDEPFDLGPWSSSSR